MFCSKCGKENVDDARFCYTCGSGLFLAAQPIKPEMATPPQNDAVASKSLGTSLSEGEFKMLWKTHWLGGYSLGASFWGVSVLLGLLFCIGVSIFAWMLMSVFDSSVIFSKVFPLVYGSLYLAYACWSGVGTWRSAGFHVQRGGQAVWSIVVKVLLGLGVFFWGAVLVGFLLGLFVAGSDGVQTAPVDRVSSDDSVRESSSNVSSQRTSDVHERAAQWLQKQPLFVTIAKYDQAGYAKAHQTVLAGMEVKTPEEELNKQVFHVLLNEIIPVYMAASPDSALLRFVRAQVDLYDSLMKTAPVSCDSMIHPESTDLDAQLLWAPALKEEYLSALDAMVKAWAWSPQEFKKTPQFEQDFKNAVKYIEQDKRAKVVLDVLKTPEKYKSESGALCASMIVFYAAVFVNAPDEARRASVLRGVYSSK